MSHSRKTFVITRNNANTFFLCILNGPRPHLPILALSMVLTQLNIWCANLFDIIVYGQISSFMINPNGLYGHVPLTVPLSLVGSGFDPVYTLHSKYTGPVMQWSYFADIRRPLATRWVRVRQPLLI